MRISENWPEMLALTCYCRAQRTDPGKYRGNNAIEAASAGRGHRDYFIACRISEN